MPKVTTQNTNAKEAREALLPILKQNVHITGLHPHGIADVTTPQYVATYLPAFDLIEVFDRTTADCLFRSGSQSVYCPDRFIPGEWLDALTGVQVAAA